MLNLFQYLERMIGAFFAVIVPAVHYIFYAEPQHKRMSFPSGLKSQN
jgi:hypothetical protein